MAPALLHSDYTIAWICALPLELAAAKVMLDEIHQTLPKPTTDPNAYALGNIHGHHIVIACLPTGIYGTISAATVISHLRSTFPQVQYALMVGIGGGVPRNDIRLGDVVISKPVGKHSGLIQYDYGKAVQGGQFEQSGVLNSPPLDLLTHMSYLQGHQMTESQNSILTIVSDVLERNPGMKKEFASPSQHTDYLFQSSYHHINQEENGCEECDKQQLIYRKPRDSEAPHIHYGLIASGDQVMKDSEKRDLLAQQLEGILCFEMEAAGLVNQLPTLVIRGICDYCDSHKQKEWQGYAALTAAAYTKLLLSVVPVSRRDIDPIQRKKTRHWMVSLARNLKFVGRQDEVVKLEKLITVQDGPRKIAITGLGGVGKTQIALEVVYRIRDQDPECSIFWIPCTSYGTVEQTFLQIAQVLGLHEVNGTGIKEQVKLYLSSERAGKWLVIFDNADDAEMWLTGSHTIPPLEDFLPQSEHGRVLFTTRNRKLGIKLAPSSFIPIPDMDQDTAVKILESTLAHPDLLRDTTITSTFLEQLAFLPLAIAQASAYIIENGIDLSTYLGLLQEQEQDTVELLSEDFRDPGRYHDIQNPVITTWFISFKQIQDQNQLAADYLSLMACINPRSIPQSLLPQPGSKKQKIDALGLLNAYSFTNNQAMDISMHRLVHIATRNWLRKNTLFSHCIQRTADQMKMLFPVDHYTHRKLWREYLPHALALVHENEYIIQEGSYLSLTKNIADCLASDGRCQEAEVLYERLIRVNQEKAGTGHPFTLTCMASLALIYWKQGHWNKAENLEIQVLETRQRVLGINYPATLTSMVNLASTYCNQGQLNRSEKLEIEAIEIRKRVLGTNHPDTLTSMANLASTYQHQGRWNEAKKLKEHVVEMRKRVLGINHPDTLTSIANLASTYWNEARWDEAEKLEMQVMEARMRMLGTNHPDTLTSMANLASTYQSQGRWNEAEKLKVQVMETRKIVLGAQHPDTLNSMANLATVYKNRNLWTEAENLEMRVLETRKTVLGTEHPSTLTSMGNLAYTWKREGKLNDALTLMKECCNLRSKVLGPNHPKSKASFSSFSNWMNEKNTSLD